MKLDHNLRNQGMCPPLLNWCHPSWTDFHSLVQDNVSKKCDNVQPKLALENLDIPLMLFKPLQTLASNAMCARQSSNRQTCHQ